MLALEGVNAAYGLSRVLTEVGLKVNAGEAVALLGRNGVGKTTLLRTIIGLHPASAGTITFEGSAITTWPAHRRARSGIGYVPQGRGIFPQLTVEENLHLGMSASNGRERVKPETLDGIIDLFPALRRMLRRKGGVLSGGEQQQLALARALVGRPTLLLLDEPTEGIQPSIVQEIEQVLGRIRRELNVALLLVEQHLDFAWSIAERYYVMQRGTVVKDGSTQSESPDSITHLLGI